MPAGRPTKYQGEITCQKVEEYLTQCQDEEFTFHKTQGNTSDTYERHIRVKLPTIGGLSLFLGVTESTIQLWEKEHEEFSVSLRKVVKEQERRLLEGGLSGDYNSTIAKLVLSSNHGYKERTDQTTNDKDLPQPILANVIPNNDSDKKDSPDKEKD